MPAGILLFEYWHHVDHRVKEQDDQYPPRVFCRTPLAIAQVTGYTGPDQEMKLLPSLEETNQSSAEFRQSVDGSFKRGLSGDDVISSSDDQSHHYLEYR